MGHSPVLLNAQCVSGPLWNDMCLPNWSDQMHSVLNIMVSRFPSCMWQLPLRLAALLLALVGQLACSFNLRVSLFLWNMGACLESCHVRCH